MIISIAVAVLLSPLFINSDQDRRRREEREEEQSRKEEDEFDLTMAWRSHGRNNAELINNLFCTQTLV